MKNSPFKIPTLPVKVYLFKKKNQPNSLCYKIYIWYALTGWLTADAAIVYYFIKYIFKWFFHWINLSMLLKGRENGREGGLMCRINFALWRNPHDCTQFKTHYGSSTTKHLMHWSVSRVEVGKSHKMRLKSLDGASCSLTLTQRCEY